MPDCTRFYISPGSRVLQAPRYLKLQIQSFVAPGYLKLQIWSFVAPGYLKLWIWSFVAPGYLKLWIWSFVAPGYLKLQIWSFVAPGYFRLQGTHGFSKLRIYLRIEFILFSFTSNLSTCTRFNCTTIFCLLLVFMSVYYSNNYNTKYV